MTEKRKWDPTKKTTRWNPRMEFDIITGTVDGGAIWHDYGDPRRVIVTRKGENPREVALRDREKHEAREADVARRERAREIEKKGGES